MPDSTTTIETSGYYHPVGPAMPIETPPEALAEIDRLRAREKHLLSVIRYYNPDDALFDHEKVATIRRVSLPRGAPPP